MTLPQDRMARYDMLDLREQLLLEYLSFVARPLFKNEVVEQFGAYLKAFGIQAPRCDEMVSQLAASGYLTRLGGKLELARGIWEEVSARSAEAGRAQLQCEIATSPKFPRTEEDLFIKVRRAAYTGQSEKAVNLLKRELQTDFYNPLDHSDPVAKKFLKGLCSATPLKFYPHSLASEVAFYGLVHSVNQAVPAQHLYDWLCDNLDPQQEPNSYAMWMHQELLRESPTLKDIQDPVIRGLANILHGDLSHFDELLSIMAVGDIPRQFDFSSQEFIYLAGCYARNELNFAQERLRHGSDILHPLALWFWEVRSGRENNASPHLLAQMGQREYPAVLQFYQTLLLYWSGFDRHLEPGRVFSLARRYEDAGYIAMSGPLFALYRQMVGEETEESPFLDLLKPSELWETTLSQLESWKAFTESVKGEAPEERVAWFLSLRSGRPTVTARLQRRNKTGRWSKGRVVAIDQMRYECGAVMDARDHRVVEDSAGLDHSYRGDRYKVLEALVEHPRLFNEEGDPLEIVRGVPRLLVQQGEDHLRLQLTPQAFERSRYALLRLNDRRYELVTYDQTTDGLTRLIPRDGVDIPKDQEERVRSILAVASLNGFSVESYFAVGGAHETASHDGKLIVRLYPQGKGLRAEVGIQPFGANQGFTFPGEGERYLSKRTELGVVEIRRNLEKELEDFHRFMDLVPGFHDAEAFFATPVECLELLESLRKLPADWITIAWPQGKKFALNRMLGSSDVRFSIRREHDWFSVEAQLVLSSGEELQLATLIERSRQQQGRFIELDDGSYVALTQDLERRIRAMEAAVSKEKDGRLLFTPLASSVLFADADFAEVDEFWLETQARMEQTRTLEPTLPAGFEGELRAYQRDGFDWLIRSAAWGVGVCLADDMGLGKTVQILAALLSRSDQGPSLVIAPTSVCANWKEESERFTPELEVTLYNESDRERVLDHLGPGRLVVCSYGLLCRDIDKLKSIEWNTVVLDESQAIKNTQTQRYKAAIALQAQFRVAATGTPVENHLGELWALFRFLNPGLLGSHRTFQARYARDDKALESLRLLLSPFLLRRLKKDVLQQLPPKTEVTLSVELSRQERLFYESLRVRAVEKIEEERVGLIGILAELMRLRRACCHPTLAGGEKSLGSSKLDSFFELLEGLLEGGHRALVFSQFVDHLAIVEDELKKRGVSYQYLDGSTPPKKRADAVRAFQEGEGDLFLISLKAGGTGLNLTAANYVIHLDPWWNPATEDQASDRAHRIGQEQAVTVYRLIGKDTIEEKILNLHKEKREMVDSLLEGSDRAGKLSADELMSLLREGHGLGLGV